MSKIDQNNFEQFKNFLNETIASEEKKVSQLGIVKTLVNDKDLEKYYKRRSDFFNFCLGCKTNYQNITDIASNEKYIDNSQKEFYLNIDHLKKEGLKLMAKNQKQWFEKLFKNNFDMLKILLRSLLVYENQKDIMTMERMIQEIELLRFKSNI